MKTRLMVCMINDDMTADCYDGDIRTHLNNVDDLIMHLEDVPYGKGYTHTLCYTANLRVDAENMVHALDHAGPNRHNMVPDKISLTKMPIAPMYSAMCTERVTYTLRFAHSNHGRPVEVRGLDNLYTGWTNADLCEAAGTDDLLTAMYEAATQAKVTFGGSIPVTAASAAFKDFKKSLKKGAYDKVFPRLTVDEDDFARRAYYGGCVMYKAQIPEYNTATDVSVMEQMRRLAHGDGSGYVLDKTSMYPTYMRNYPLPVGKPSKGNINYFWDHINRMEDIDFCVEYWSAQMGRDVTPDEADALERREYYFVKANIKANIHNDTVPCIKWPRAKAFDSCNYVINMAYSDCFYLTETDFINMRDKYDIEECEIMETMRYETQVGVFAKYIDKWFTVKHDAKNKCERKLAKLMINGLSGKLAQYYNDTYYIPFVKTSTGCVEYFDIENEGESEVNEDGVELSRNDKYVPAAAAITAYGRAEISTIATDNYDILYGGDTDSIFVSGTPKGVDVGDELGQYKVEHEFDCSLFVGKKTYIIHDINDGWVIKGAGMSDEVKSEIIERARSIMSEHPWISAAPAAYADKIAHITAFQPGQTYIGSNWIKREPGKSTMSHDKAYTIQSPHTCSVVSQYVVDDDGQHNLQLVQIRKDVELSQPRYDFDDDLPF